MHHDHPRLAHAEVSAERQDRPKAVREALQTSHQVAERLGRVDATRLTPAQRERGTLVGTRLARHLRMLAVALSVSGGAYGVYEGMDSVARRMANMVERALAPLRINAEEQDTPSPGSTEGTVSSADPVSTEQSSVVPPASEEETAQALIAPEVDEETQRQRVADQEEADRADGHAFAEALWNDPAFLSLSTAEEMERYAASRIDAACSPITIEDPEAPDAGPACNNYTIRETLQSDLQNRAMQSVQRGDRDPEQLLRVARGMNRLTGTGLRNEVDIAMQTGRADIVRTALGDEVLSGMSSPSAHRGVEYALGFSRSSGDLERLSRVYVDLPTDQQEALRERIVDQAGYFERRALSMRQQANEGRDGAARQSADTAEAEYRQVQQALARMRIELPNDDEDDT